MRKCLNKRNYGLALPLMPKSDGKLNKTTAQNENEQQQNHLQICIVYRIGELSKRWKSSKTKIGFISDKISHNYRV